MTPSTYQPRWAAFMAAHGRTDAAFNTLANRVRFVCDFIPHCRRTAPQGVVTHGRVVDHVAFTAHCWAVALGGEYGRNAA